MTLPALVTLTVWGIPRRQIPHALGRMATQRGAVRDYPGVTFAKLLGTGSGRTFTVRDYDLTHWALLACWDSPQAASAFERSRSSRSWNSACVERLRIELIPLASRGQWSGQQPFGPDALPASSAAQSGTVAAITRARLRASTARTFWRAVPDVSKSLSRSPGLMLSLGIGEA
ncbi:MAG: monooxygenase, partial [Candidatus Nanopelagicales bacterium]